MEDSKLTMNPKYICTRCSKNEIEARQEGCKDSPCPMALIYWYDRFWFWLTGRV